MNIYFEEIKIDELKDFDIQQICDVIIKYEPSNPEFISGVATVSLEHDKPLIIIYYLELEYGFSFLSLIIYYHTPTN